MSRLRFGIFMAPFHAPPGQNPTTALARDVATIQLLDELGYDEAWVGEHHSCGTEIIASPEIFIAHVAVADPAHQARHRRAVAAVPQPAVGGRPGDPARPPPARPVHARPRAGRAADRRRDDRHRPGRAAPGARGGHRGARAPAAQRRAGHQDDAAVQPGRGPLPAAPVHRPVLRDRRRRDRLAVGAARRRPARRCRCCRSGPRSSATSTCWPCTGTSPRSGPPSSARPCPATAGASSARCTSPRPASRRCSDVEYGIEAWFDYLQHTAAAPQFHPLGDTLEERDRLGQRDRASASSARRRTPSTRSTSCTSSRTAASAAT